jgi:hypothetical protein
MMYLIMAEPVLGSNFSTFLRLFLHLKCESEHGLHDGTVLEQPVLQLGLRGLSHSRAEQALAGPFHSTLSCNGLGVKGSI